MLSNVVADEPKTYTISEVKTAVFNIPSNVSNFLTSEVEKTKAYQKESWAEMKTQTAQNWAQLKSLFGVKN
tara:strand:- start:1282 stop:1494 length:213 start_codon:yes stop_codon:yes gene_type:complete